MRNQSTNVVVWVAKSPDAQDTCSWIIGSLGFSCVSLHQAEDLIIAVQKLMAWQTLSAMNEQSFLVQKFTLKQAAYVSKPVSVLRKSRYSSRGPAGSNKLPKKQMS